MSSRLKMTLGVDRPPPNVMMSREFYETMEEFEAVQRNLALGREDV